MNSTKENTLGKRVMLLEYGSRQVPPQYQEFIHDDDIGYFQNNSLISPTKDIIKLNADDKIRIAHPIDLYKSNLWHIYQQDLFTRQIKQPFKQIFRELYLKINDELNSAQSHRYDGYQIQPQKTQAVLKTRNWIASYYEGLQKVYYQENIIATIYAAVDWFTPADIEAPILEYVAFYDRKTFKDSIGNSFREEQTDVFIYSLQYNMITTMLNYVNLIPE